MRGSGLCFSDGLLATAEASANSSLIEACDSSG
jgi:hypothetical protein